MSLQLKIKQFNNSNERVMINYPIDDIKVEKIETTAQTVLGSLSIILMNSLQMEKGDMKRGLKFGKKCMMMNLYKENIVELEY